MERSFVMEPDDIVSYAQIHHLDVNSSICISLDKNKISEGLFYENNPFDYSPPLLLVQLSLPAMVNLSITRLLQPLGLPIMALQILGGLLLGPSFLGRIEGLTTLMYPFHSLVVVDTLALFGYMLYFFLIGVQMDPWIFKKIKKKDITIGISTVVLALILSISGAFILSSGTIPLDPDIASSLASMAIASSVLGFPMISLYLTELKMLNSEFGRTALCSSLVSNLLSFCVINIAIISHQQPSEIYRSLLTGFNIFVFVLVIAFVVRPMILWAVRRNSEGEPMKQWLILMVLIGALVSGFLTKVMGCNALFGPLFYGMAIPAGPPLGSALVEKTELIVSWIFMPLYFVKNGLVIDIFSVKFKDYLVLQFVIVIACCGKFLGGMLSALYNRMPIREAIQIGLVTNVQGVLELCMFKRLKQNKNIKDEALRVMCVSMIIVTSAITPIQRYLYDPLKRHGVVNKRRTIMNRKLNCELRMIACVHNQEDVPSIINFVENLHRTKHVPTNIFLIHFIELVGRAHPILISHKMSSVVSSKATSSRSIVNAFQVLLQRHSGDMALHSFTSISPYAIMHDEVYRMAINMRACLIVIPFHKRLTRTGLVECSSAGMKMMNNRILQMAPCTVAIIVDRAPMTDFMRACPKILYRIALFFIGGQDDREALAIGAKMVSQPNINLTIIRVLEKSSKVVNDDHLDNEAVNQIRSQTTGNYKVMFIQEEEVTDGNGTLEVIRSIENRNYDLIIVGRNRNKSSTVMLGLSEWEEDDSELGTIGHIFASTDSTSQSTILVVQHPNDNSIMGEL